MTWKIEKAQPSDAPVLTELTRESKAYWAYSEDQLLLWKDELSVRPEYIQENGVYVLWESGLAQAYYSYKENTQAWVYLDNLFVHPRAMGKGIGKALLLDFEARVQNLAYSLVKLEADPHAETFYQRFLYQTVNRKESSIPGRYLPIMEKKLGT